MEEEEDIISLLLLSVLLCLLRASITLACFLLFEVVSIQADRDSLKNLLQSMNMTRN